jgi:hypothetical protein
MEGHRYLVGAADTSKTNYHMLAHGFISQLDVQFRDAVLSNCSTVFASGVGAKDAPLSLVGKGSDWNADC